MTDNHYDLSAVSRQLGELIDPEAQRRIQRERLVAFAQKRHVDLKPEDIKFTSDGEAYIDGMPAADWLEHMTEERP
jgi:sugar lactone lactonase YvrE